MAHCSQGTSLVAQMVKNLLKCRRPKFSPWVRKIPWRSVWQPTPEFLPGEPYEQRSLVAYSPLGCKESDTTEQLTHTHTHTHTHITLRAVSGVSCGWCMHTPLWVCVLSRIATSWLIHSFCFAGWGPKVCTHSSKMQTLPHYDVSGNHLFPLCLKLHQILESSIFFPSLQWLFYHPIK